MRFCCTLHFLIALSKAHFSWVYYFLDHVFSKHWFFRFQWEIIAYHSFFTRSIFFCLFHPSTIISPSITINIFNCSGDNQNCSQNNTSCSHRCAALASVAGGDDSNTNSNAAQKDNVKEEIEVPVDFALQKANIFHIRRLKKMQFFLWIFLNYFQLWATHSPHERQYDGESVDETQLQVFCLCLIDSADSPHAI